MTWDVKDSGGWGVATTDTPADMAAALALHGSWAIDAERCLVRRSQWDDLAPVNPAPTLASIAPSTGVAGDAVMVTCTGTGYVNTSVVVGDNGLPVGTTAYLSATSLQVGVNLASTAAGPYAVHVRTDPPGGGLSAQQLFTVTAAEEEAD